MAFALVYISELASRCARRQLSIIRPSSISSVQRSSFTRCFAVLVMALAERESLVMRSLLVGLALTAVALTAPKVDSVNTFDAPNAVVPKPVSAKLQGSKLTLKLEPKSVTVISVE